MDSPRQAALRLRLQALAGAAQAFDAAWARTGIDAGTGTQDGAAPAPACAPMTAPAPAPWLRVKAGVRYRLLDGGGVGDRGSACSLLLEMEPGSALVPQDGIAHDELLVWQGAIEWRARPATAGTPGDLALREGDYLHAPAGAGSLHSRGGAVLFLRAAGRRGPPLSPHPPPPTLAAPVRAGDNLWRDAAPGVQCKALRQDGSGGDRRLLRMRAGSSMGPPPAPQSVDEELLVLDGRLRCGPLQLKAGDWLRHPAAAPARLLQTDSGALLLSIRTMP